MKVGSAESRSLSPVMIPPAKNDSISHHVSNAAKSIFSNLTNPRFLWRWAVVVLLTIVTYAPLVVAATEVSPPPPSNPEPNPTVGTTPDNGVGVTWSF